MEDDVARTLREVDRDRAEASREAAGMAASWRRLRTLRDGLARERAARAASVPLLPTDRDAVVAELLDAYDGRIREAEREAARAEAAAAAWVSSARVLERLSPAWRAERDRLAAAAATARSSADRLASERPHRLPGYERDAGVRVAANARANARATEALAPLDARIAALDLAVAAVSAGDNHAKAALQRWDLVGLVRVGALWRRLRDGEALSQAEWEVYVGDGRDPADGDPLAAGLLEAVARILAERGGAPGTARPAGRVFEGEWTEADPAPVGGRPRAATRPRLPPPEGGIP